MQSLKEKIESEGRYLGSSILKVDSFLNHQVDTALMTEIGEQLYKQLSHNKPVTKVLTAEASGILPAMATAMAAQCRMIYARKSMSKTMVDNCYTADAISRTRGNGVTFYVNSRFLNTDDRVLIIEDFLATGSSISALVEIVNQSGATLAGIGTVIEKPAEHGRAVIAEHLTNSCLTASLVQISFESDKPSVETGKNRIVKPKNTGKLK